jgi:type III pantothenate kinase
MLVELGVSGGPPVPVVATGGYAPVLLGESALVQHFEPWLTLVGLGLVFERNDPRGAT